MKTNFRITPHAQWRAQQRAIPKDIIPVLIALGAAKHQKGGTLEVCMTDDVERRLRRITKRLDSLRNTYLILGDDGAVITVGHRHK